MIKDFIERIKRDRKLDQARQEKKYRERLARLFELETPEKQKGFHLPNPVAEARRKKEIKELRAEIEAYERNQNAARLTPIAIIGFTALIVIGVPVAIWEETHSKKEDVIIETEVPEAPATQQAAQAQAPPQQQQPVVTFPKANTPSLRQTVDYDLAGRRINDSANYTSYYIAVDFDLRVMASITASYEYHGSDLRKVDISTKAFDGGNAGSVDGWVCKGTQYKVITEDGVEYIATYSSSTGEWTPRYRVVDLEKIDEIVEFWRDGKSESQQRDGLWP